MKKITHSKLFKDSFIYVFSNFINKAIPFFLLPVLSYYLTPEDYGVLAIFNSSAAILFIFIGLSVQGAITVNYYKLKKEELAQYIGNIIYILLSSFFLFILIIFLMKDCLSSKLGLPYNWILAAALMAFSTFFTTINFSLWMVEQKPKLYGSLQIGETVIKFGLSLFFVIILAMSWKGRALGMLIGGILTASISIFLLYKRNYLNFRLNKEYIKDALHFGLPLLPHQLGFWLRSGGIIFILAYLVGEKETGLYNAGMQFVMPISILSAAFNKAWMPYLYKTLSSNPSSRNKRKIVSFTYYYFIGILLMAILLSMIAPFLIQILLEKSFFSASAYIYYLSLAMAFQGMYYMVVNYIFYKKKNKYLAYITFAVSITGTGLAYWLIKTNGSIGAAQTLLLTNFLSFILVWFYSNKVYRMPWKKTLIPMQKEK